MRPLQIGSQFGRLIVLERATGRCWKCVCECGSYTYPRADHLTSGRVLSCGCHRAKQLSIARTTHGLTRTRIYRIYRNMITRCHWDKYHEWKYYGGRGIQVCERWRQSFENFLSDMGIPDRHLTLDRIDVNGNYEPANCRWTTWDVQMANRRPRQKNGSTLESRK